MPAGIVVNTPQLHVCMGDLVVRKQLVHTSVRIEKYVRRADDRDNLDFSVLQLRSLGYRGMGLPSFREFVADQAALLSPIRSETG